jgi:hypothetical protein
MNFNKLFKEKNLRIVLSCFNKPRFFHNLAEINVYNSLSKSKEPLRLNNKNALYWYSCGPTVYDSAHIGHAW